MSYMYALYLCNGHAPDPAIRRGLEGASCRVVVRRTVGEALSVLTEGCRFSDALPLLSGEDTVDTPAALAQQAGQPEGEADDARFPALVVAEVEAGALVLLSLLNEWRGSLLDAGVGLGGERRPPAVVVFDRHEGDIRIAAKALELGAWRYLLGSDPELERELAIHAVARRVEGYAAGGSRDGRGPAVDARPNIRTQRIAGRGGRPERDDDLEWDARGRIVRSPSGHAVLSATEARVFGTLYGNRGQVTPMAALAREVFSPDELTRYRQGEGEVDAHAVGQRLRPLMMRLRRKLMACPEVSGRLISVRGKGYMMR